jgi:hypothetical protein
MSFLVFNTLIFASDQPPTQKQQMAKLSPDQVLNYTPILSHIGSFTELPTTTSKAFRQSKHMAASPIKESEFDIHQTRIILTNFQESADLTSEYWKYQTVNIHSYDIYCWNRISAMHVIPFKQINIHLEAMSPDHSAQIVEIITAHTETQFQLILHLSNSNPRFNFDRLFLHSNKIEIRDWPRKLFTQYPILLNPHVQSKICKIYTFDNLHGLSQVKAANGKNLEIVFKEFAATDEPYLSEVASSVDRFELVQFYDDVITNIPQAKMDLISIDFNIEWHRNQLFINQIIPSDTLKGIEIKLSDEVPVAILSLYRNLQTLILKNVQEIGTLNYIESGKLQKLSIFITGPVEIDVGQVLERYQGTLTELRIDCQRGARDAVIDMRNINMLNKLREISVNVERCTSNWDLNIPENIRDIQISGLQGNPVFVLNHTKDVGITLHLRPGILYKIPETIKHVVLDMSDHDQELVENWDEFSEDQSEFTNEGEEDSVQNGSEEMRSEGNGDEGSDIASVASDDEGSETPSEVSRNVDYTVEQGDADNSELLSDTTSVMSPVPAEESVICNTLRNQLALLPSTLESLKLESESCWIQIPEKLMSLKVLDVNANRIILDDQGKIGPMYATLKVLYCVNLDDTLESATDGIAIYY